MNTGLRSWCIKKILTGFKMSSVRSHITKLNSIGFRVKQGLTAAAWHFLNKYGWLWFKWAFSYKNDMFKKVLTITQNFGQKNKNNSITKCESHNDRWNVAQVIDNFLGSDWIWMWFVRSWCWEVTWLSSTRWNSH